MTWEAIAESSAGVNGNYNVNIENREFDIARFLSPWIRDLP
jgi:hypothetical protein